MNYLYLSNLNTVEAYAREKIWLCAGLMCVISLLGITESFAQGQFTGTIKEAESGNPLGGATIVIVGTSAGAISDQQGTFKINSPKAAPFTVQISSGGYDTLVQEVSSISQPATFSLIVSSVNLDEVEIVATALSERQQQEALTVESMSITAIKETPAPNFYEGLGHLKGVDINAASFGFKIVNTRGFNSTQPVRSLQLIDGVDNQSPGLNFSLGNFLGASELDVQSVDLVVGASSAFYGPNAFNGVIAMETKSPFIHKGLSVSLKGGERNWLESAVRYAKAFKGKDGKDKFAFKLNLFYLRADDWEADNFDEAYRDVDEVGTIDYVTEDNPGGYDAVNRYGDEIYTVANVTGFDLIDFPGLGIYYRTGYKEGDLLDYDTRNFKASGALHYKVTPKIELIAGSSYSNGTTVFQGVNRISLKDIQFFQHKVELKQHNKFFLRAYMTHEDAGNSYDPVFTAFRLQGLASNDLAWSQTYRSVWRRDYVPQVKQLEGFPGPPGPPDFRYDLPQQEKVLAENQEQLRRWHEEVRGIADGNSFLVPGTPAFQAAFDSITSRVIGTEGGTRFYDKSALYHMHGEYKFTPSFADITIGANGRLYTPVTEGSIFSDTAGIRIRNFEYGVYGGIKKGLASDRLTLTATLRMDKNQNFDFLFSPAATALFKINEKSSVRASFSAAIRNPTLADQYLDYDIGGATLVGNITGYENLITLESLRTFLITFNSDDIERFDIERIKPERVRTFEVGYRGLLGDQLYVDANYYFSRYQDFIGFRFGYFGDIFLNFPVGTVYRVAANAADVVTTQGAAIGVNYFFPGGYTIGGNYSWNVLNTQTDDPIVPAFNTPEHKFNINFGARDIEIGSLNNIGFNVNYKWVEGFIFEGSPQFTGIVPTYDLLDVQVNKRFDDINTTVKIGASNILNNKVFTVYGGPRIGRLAYISFTYDFVQK